MKLWHELTEKEKKELCDHWIEVWRTRNAQRRRRRLAKRAMRNGR